MAEELTWAPGWRIRELIRAKELSPVEVLEHFLARIAEHQPVLQAFDRIDEEGARRAAKAAEAAVLAGDELGLLQGIPMAVKSHIDIKGLPQTMPFGSDISQRDDVTVERLRGAGAVIVGHTGMPVFTSDGGFDHEASARNPWDPYRTPGISSAGTAAAVAAGLLPAVLSSDGGGSSRVLAAYSGVVGVHPTGGLVPWVDSRRQVARPTSTIGPTTRDVRDAATVLSVIAGPDGRDLTALHVDLPDPRCELDRGAEGLKLAWTDDFGFALNYAVEESPRVISHIRDAVLALNRIGAVVEPTETEWEDYLDANRVHSFAGIPSMGIQGVTSVSADAWQDATERRQRNWLRFRKLFGEYDLLLSPTIHSVAPTLDVFAARLPSGLSLVEGGPGPDSYTVYTGQFNWLMFPALSVPCGFVDGLPVGLQIVGPPGRDPTLLRLAYAFCQAFPQDRHPPVS